MKRILLSLAILAWAKVGWAANGHLDGGNWVVDPNMMLELEGYKLAVGTWTLNGQNWIVSKGSEAYTFEDFVSSGRFCEWRGKHEWIKPEYHGGVFLSPMQDGCGGWVDGPKELPEKCSFCHRCRRKITVKKEEEEWEP